MKLLAIGDFHGKFPSRLLKKLKKEEFDLIVSPGDFCGNEELNRLFFKYVYGTDKELWEFIGKRKAEELDRANLKAGEKIIRKLAKLGKKVIAVRGNWDPTYYGEIGFPLERDKYARRFVKISARNNVRIIDFKNFKLYGWNFIGYPRSTFPGMMTKAREKRLKKRDLREAVKVIRKTKEDNKKYFLQIRRSFSNNSIFISHNCPYNTKLDKIKKGPMKGKHYGSWLARKIMKELKPAIVICGHMHENQGMQMIGKSLVVNTGAAKEGKAAIIEIEGEKIKSVRFLR